MAVVLPEARGGELLTFVVAGTRLALPAGEVAEIIRPRTLTRVPHGPPGLLGVTNLRGLVLPVVSLARLLDHAEGAPSRSTRIIVLNDGAPVGLLVDAIAGLGHETDARRLDIESLLARTLGGLPRRASARPETVVQTPATAASRADHEVLALIGFRLAGQEYALPLDKVAEVLAVPADIAALPRTDQAMIGVTAVRGGLLPLVSLRVLLGLPAQGYDPARARIIVTRLGKAPVGLLVDGIREILRVPAEAVDPVPPVLTRGGGETQIDAICRLDGGRRLISILSPARLFHSDTAARILAGAEQGAIEMSSTRASTDAAEQFVVFRLGDEHYGLPIAAVDEVVRRPETLPRVPHAPDFVEGVMNLRGKVVPVIDQRRRFAVEGADSGRRQRILVVSFDGLQAGFVVDAVSEVLEVPAAELQPVPEITGDGARTFDRIATIEHGGRLILLVNPKTLLDRAERDLLAGIAARGEAVSGP